MDAYSWKLVGGRYGTKRRKGRRPFHKLFNMKAVTNFDDYQRKHTYLFISRYSTHLSSFFLMLNCTYSLGSGLAIQAGFYLFECDRRVDHGDNLRFEH
jgi:hypothetical protein